MKDIHQLLTVDIRLILKTIIAQDENNARMLSIWITVMNKNKRGPQHAKFNTTKEKKKMPRKI